MSVKNNGHRLTAAEKLKRGRGESVDGNVKSHGTGGEKEKEVKAPPSYADPEPRAAIKATPPSPRPHQD